MNAQSKDLGPAERAVYDLVERGGIGAPHAALYRRQLGSLVRAGLVRRNEDGSYAAVALMRAGGGLELTAARPPSEPASAPLPTLVVRVPQEVIDALDASLAPGETRSDAAREALARGLAKPGSGLRRAVRPPRASYLLRARPGIARA